MSKSKHTPGPWKVKYYHKAGRQHGDLETPEIMCNQERIASVSIYGAAQGNKDIAEANALLIAAAPALLAKYKKISKHEDGCKQRGVGYDISVDEIAKAAIAEAEKGAE